MINLDNLNENQKKAVTTVNGSVLVLAGAGSGKTKVLTTRIAYLIENNIPGYNILAITFTNKAAKEMKTRVNSIIDNCQSFIGTFHAFGLRIIKENHEYFNLTSNFTILDSDDVMSVIKRILKDKNISKEEIAPAFIRSKISFIKSEMLSDSDIIKYLNTDIEKKVIPIYNEYIKILRRNNAIDFDDLLKLPVELFIDKKEVLNHYQDKYQYILIDEYQDTNEVQYRLSKLLASKYKNIFVVGDPDQSIYSFRGANYQNILNFERDYKDTLVIPLEENYRSTNTILNAANDVIKNNIKRKDKTLFSHINNQDKIKYLRAYDEKQEIKLIIDEINNLLNNGYKNNEIAVLYRTNAQSRVVEEVFIKSGIPYKVVGSYYFFNRSEIKDLICYLRLINNHNDDVSLKRIINIPRRKIGAKTVETLEKVAEISNKSMYESIESGKELEFKNLIEELTKDSESLSLTELIDDILEKTMLKKSLLDEHTLDSENKLENLLEFRSITASFEDNTGIVNLQDFLDEISLVADTTEHKETNDEITLMTVHGAKGLEFRVVFIIGAEEGLFPHINSFYEKDGIEEERRLCYVAITRAKEKLYISNAKSRMLYGKTSNNMPSRFISEINNELIEEHNEMIKKEDKVVDKKDMYDDSNKEYNKGDIVIHNIYGRGVIVDVDDKYFSIAFAKNYGVRKVLRTFKGLKR